MKPMIRNIALFMPLFLFMGTEDFNFKHIINVSSEEYNFRMGEFNRYSPLWYQRADLKSPSKYVVNVFKDGDVIVVGVIGAGFYVNKPFVNYIKYGSQQFLNMSRKRGKEEIWTGRPLIHSLEDFFNIVPADPNRSLWLIGVIKDFYGNSFENANSIIGISEDHEMNANLKYVGIDGRVGVWEVKRLSDANRAASHENH
jgi:hypothetical protein